MAQHQKQRIIRSSIGKNGQRADEKSILHAVTSIERLGHDNRFRKFFEDNRSNRQVPLLIGSEQHNIHFK